jgi:hypothetical protein
VVTVSAEGLRTTRNRLVLARSTSERRDAFCRSELADGDHEEFAVQVSYVRSARDVVADWEAHDGHVPDRLHVVHVQEHARPDADGLPDGITASTANPNDLTGVAMRLQDVLHQASEYDDPQLCFDSITFLLQYHDVASAFKFLHMLTSQLRDAGVEAHFHADPDALEPQTLARVRAVMDEEVDLAGD